MNGRRIRKLYVVCRCVCIAILAHISGCAVIASSDTLDVKTYEEGTAQVILSENGRNSMFEQDTFHTSDGELVITFIGHGTLMMEFGEMVIHIDPIYREADYQTMPKADLILITHGHRDHLDTDALETLRKENTTIILPEKSASAAPDAVNVSAGNKKELNGIKIEVVHAYNIKHKRPTGEPFHPKGDGVGYVLTFGDKRVYIAGDTENISEMENIRDIDVAFLPVNLPYTMTLDMAAEAAKTIRPKVLYPYHFGETEIERLNDLLANENDIEVRIRKMK